MHITLTEIVTSLFLYGIVHGIIYIARNAERFVVSHADHILRLHVLGGHKQHPSTCTDGRCNELATVTSIDAITL